MDKDQKEIRNFKDLYKSIYIILLLSINMKSLIRTKILLFFWNTSVYRKIEILIISTFVLDL